MWSARDISIFGRINIVKTIAISKLNFVCSILNIPDLFTTDVDKSVVFSNLKIQRLSSKLL